ncbi:MAG: pitrilysin family protein [Vicinamibacterales bacterium]|jgi:predicted Zn-dependent peptidase|nr:pitrilysin family protein [Vicinamibacterales bacterium]HAK56916.1 peptidase M16 [Acidobacteriota bacterium]|tara:strand:- start:812 stop:2200 length:1389 start_codon:yes stop_codon:yes gene_type:complete
MLICRGWRWRAALRATLPVAAVALSAAVGATAQTVEFSDTTLENGLRVIIAEDHVAPVVSIAVNYDVGSRNERRGRTGFAHLFEHMMFEGSENVGDGEHFLLVANNGGDVNGTTDKDRTLYFERMPSNQLELGLFLEADRMASLDITPENLDNQRNAVQEERRLRIDNQPYGHTFEAVDELAYENFAYAHSIIGSMTDLNAATVTDVSSFFRTYYAPNNAVLAIVGSVDTAAALELVRKYFGPIQRQPPPPEVDLTEPPQTAERRASYDDPLARLARVDIAYHIPESLSADHDALSVLSTVLSSGRSSRLYQGIVRDTQLGVQVGAFAVSNRGPSLFRVIGIAAPGADVAALEAALYEEIDRIKAEPVESWELDKARNDARRSFVSSLGSSLQRAILLSRYTLFYDDPGQINTRAERVAAVSAEDLRRVAREYLVESNRSVIITIPAPAGAPSGGAPGQGGF